MSHFAAMKSPLLCPKPRRPIIRCQQQSYPDVDLLDLLLLLSKGEEETGLSATAPFCGSPPKRASNPVVRDSRFGMMDCPPLLLPLPVVHPTPSMSPRGGAGCARARFAFQPPAVRVEGFDCLDGHGITAMA